MSFSPARAIGVIVPLCLALGAAACAMNGASDEAAADEASTDEGAFTVAIHTIEKFRGHEDITRLAIDEVNHRIGGATPFFTPAKATDEKPQYVSEVIRGNFETDVPSAAMLAFHPDVPEAQWHTLNTAQNIHALRNYPNDHVEPAVGACYGTRRTISQAAYEADKHFKQNGRWWGMYFVGHGAHTLQDSFSTAHTVRTGGGLLTLKDVCTYNKQFPNVCRHADYDARDIIWLSGNNYECWTNTNKRDYACLTAPAKAAYAATVDYLLAMAKVAKGQQDVDTALKPVFDKYLYCSALAP